MPTYQVYVTVSKTEVYEVVAESKEQALDNYDEGDLLESIDERTEVSSILQMDELTYPYYEVHHYTLCQGWVNTWSVIDENNVSTPQTFKTREEAQAAIDEFLREIQEEIEYGERDENHGYSEDEFMVVEIKSKED